MFMHTSISQKVTMINILQVKISQKVNVINNPQLESTLNPKP